MILCFDLLFKKEIEALFLVLLVYGHGFDLNSKNPLVLTITSKYQRGGSGSVL